MELTQNNLQAQNSGNELIYKFLKETIATFTFNALIFSHAILINKFIY